MVDDLSHKLREIRDRGLQEFDNRISLSTGLENGAIHLMRPATEWDQHPALDNKAYIQQRSLLSPKLLLM